MERLVVVVAGHREFVVLYKDFVAVVAACKD